jgi:hypothetical protein
MKSLVIQSVAAAFLAAALAPAAFAQQTQQTQPVGRAPVDNPYLNAGQAPTCTQLEMQAGLSGDECGQHSLGEVVSLKFDRDNSH